MAKKTAQETAKVFGGDFQVIDIKKIFPSKYNYRKTFDQKALDELTASVKAKGVLQPILLRPLNGKGTFEIVAGHRRHQAAVGAELLDIPAIVRVLSDEEALEVQVIENTQREDPNVMEEAWGFDRLIKIGKHTAETLAAKLDKSTDYVLRRISLLKIPDEAQKKVAAGEISLGHALLITRLRHPSEQKKFIKTLNRDGGLTVREAQRQIKGFSKDIKDAIFDIAACKTCDFLGRNQSVLFPELKNSGECMDRGCFFAKERGHIQTFLDKKKAEGFKIMSNRNEVAKLVNGAGKAEKIKGDLLMKGYFDYGDPPKRYKTDCAKCTESHIFYMYEVKNWQGKSLEFGELCLNKNCLRKMNNPKSESSSAGTSSSGTSSSTLWQHAQACRDRFLKAQLPAKVSTSEVLQKRLLIYTLLIEYKHMEGREDLLKALDPKFKAKASSWGNFMSDTEVYEAVMQTAPEILEEMLHRILIASIEATNTDVLLRLAPEAGIDMMKDFAPDKTFLDSKTKGELITLAKAGGLGLGLNESQKKGDIVEAILAHDLRGKFTKELREIVTVKK